MADSVLEIGGMRPKLAGHRSGLTIALAQLAKLPSSD